MKFPKKFPVGGKSVTLSRRKKVSEIDGNTLDGYYDRKKQEMWVHPEAEDELRTFFHEYFHVCFEESGVHQTSWNHEIEEMLCEKLGQWTADIVRKIKKSGD